ncbi:hypothetical protein LCGC14_1458720 [marine sediment metagenome]|uniref:Uncharacterized protein n=1 Tax=marine sediment metagenome TaxID=412755 RepID=A0A0F9JFN9_9ZZZZ
MKRPRVVTICGSTRFADQHAIARWEMEKTGEVICLMINYLPAVYGESIGLKHTDHFGEQLGLKELLDELHFRKIDLSDEVYVVNVDGYIGESTRREMAYAMAQGKPIRFMHPNSGEYWLGCHSHEMGQLVAEFTAATAP